MSEELTACLYVHLVAGALESLSAMADMHLKGGVASPFLVNILIPSCSTFPPNHVIRLLGYIILMSTHF